MMTFQGINDECLRFSEFSAMRNILYLCPDTFWYTFTAFFFALHQDPCSTSCSSAAAAAAASPPHLRRATADLDLKKAPQPTSFFSSP